MPRASCFDRNAFPTCGGRMGWGVMSTGRARALSNNMTGDEQRLWKHLRLRQTEGHKFRRQAPIGQYIVDFLCNERKLVVELDGGQHVERSESHAMRTSWLEAQGLTVLRFWNSEVHAAPEAVLSEIWQALSQESPRSRA